MLPKTNRQNSNIQNIAPEINEDLKSGQFLNNISNQAADEYSELINPSNESNQRPRRKRSIDLGMRDNYHDSNPEDEEEDLLDINPGKKRDKISGDDESEESYIDNKAKEVVENIEAEENSGIEYDDDERDPDAEYADMNKAYYGNLPGIDDEEKKEPGNENDLTKIDKSLKPVKELDIQVEKLSPRKKPKWYKKLFSSLMYYSGELLGKAVGTVANLLNAITGGVFTGTNSWTGAARWAFGQKFPQARRNRRNIPGWDKAQFEDRPENYDEVNIDFRRVPDIWSYPIAVEGDVAKEDEEGNEKKKPRSPVISVYVAQSSQKYTADKDYLTGHTSIGIEFSRKNRREAG